MTSKTARVKASPAIRDRRATREELLEAAVRLLQDGGLAAVSTIRLTSEVGIVQSGFYSHFRSLEECLAEATSRVVEEIRQPVRAWMEELHSQPMAEEQVIEQLTEHFLRVLDVLVPRWAFLQLLERHRGSGGTLGEAMTQLHGEVVEDVRAYLRVLLTEAGIALRGYSGRLNFLAVLIVEMVTTSTEALHANRHLERRFVAHTLAVGVNQVVMSAMEGMTPQPAS